MSADVRKAIKAVVESVSPRALIKELVIFDNQGLPVHIEQGIANEAIVAKLEELVRMLAELSSETLNQSIDKFDIRIGKEMIVIKRISQELWGAAFVEKTSTKKLILRESFSKRNHTKPWVVEMEEA